MSKAVKAMVKIGDIEIEGYMATDGTYYMSTSSVGNIIGMDKTSFGKHLSRKNKEAESLKIKGATQGQKHHQNLDSSLKIKGATQGQNSNSKNALKVEGRAGKIIACKIDLVTSFWRLQAKKGNKIADALIDALLEESIERRFDHAFEVKVSEDERNERLALRLRSKIVRGQWTGMVKSWLERDGMYYKPGTKEIAEHVPATFSSLTVQVNEKLFGVRSFQGNRDNMTEDQLEKIKSFETHLVTYGEKHKDKNAFQIVNNVLSMW